MIYDALSELEKISRAFYPRALPWAVIFCPFRAKAVSQ